MSGIIPLAANIIGDGSNFVPSYFIPTNHTNEILYRLNKVDKEEETDEKKINFPYISKVQQEFLYLSDYLISDCIQIIQSYNQSSNLIGLFQDLISLALEKLDP